MKRLLTQFQRNVAAKSRSKSKSSSRRSRKKIQGVTAVEFALGALVLAISLLMLFEMGLRIYTMSVVEYALREAVRNTKIFEGGSNYSSYNNTLRAALNESGTLWSALTPADNFSISGKYYLTYPDLIADSSFSDAEMMEDDLGYQIAEITLTYNYRPVLNVFSSATVPIVRSTLINLEHEGWEE
ncbi:pilus assembly protein [Vibrio parahaemolyticus]|nr:pilus assembly protein [Vibrio parahaemolyticus]MDG2793972.1 pilus assembly protein [Vibrio parahaemolyticus]